MNLFRKCKSYDFGKTQCRKLVLVRDGEVLELDFNRLSKVSWPAVKSLADSGVKVFPLDRRTDSFVGVTSNGSIFTQFRGEKSFADFWFSRSFHDVILTRCRRILRFTSGKSPLEPLVEGKIPRDEVIDIFAEQKAVLLRNEGSYKLYYPDSQTYCMSSDIRVVGSLITTYGISGLCHGYRYVMGGTKAFVKFSVGLNGIFSIESMYVNAMGTIRSLVVELTRSRIFFEMESASGELRLMSMSPYWNVPDLCRIVSKSIQDPLEDGDINDVPQRTSQRMLL